MALALWLVASIDQEGLKEIANGGQADSEDTVIKDWGKYCPHYVMAGSLATLLTAVI